jgi:hypothetical protein
MKLENIIRFVGNPNSAEVVYVECHKCHLKFRYHRSRGGGSGCRELP